MTQIEQNRGPYALDYVQVKHLNKDTLTIVNSEVYDKILQNIDEYYEYEVGYVPEGYEHRPDLISQVFYGTPKNWWLLMVVNNISDPFEGFNINEKILIPILT
jgi:hypothetical protein